MQLLKFDYNFKSTQQNISVIASTFKLVQDNLKESLNPTSIAIFSISNWVSSSRSRNSRRRGSSSSSSYSTLLIEATKVAVVVLVIVHY